MSTLPMTKSMMLKDLPADEIIKLLQKKRNIFLTGGAGVGKTYTIERIKKAFKKPILVAPTGIAATHIEGKTIHNFFRFPFKKEYGRGKIVQERIDILRTHDLLIIDEISMVNRYLFDWIMQRIREDAQMDIPVLVVGDFYQLPPICKRGEKTEYAFDSKLWSKQAFLTVELTKIKRSSDKEFSSVLQDLRIGKVTDEVEEYLTQLSENQYDRDYTHLFGKNEEVSKHNKMKLNRLPGETFKYKMLKDDMSQTKAQKEYFQKEIKALVSKYDEILELKEGAVVLHTKNDPSRGIYNGKKGIVTKLTKKGIWVDDLEIEMDQTEITSTYDQHKVIGTIRQYPIKLAYAITIHKSQGMSIKGLHIDLANIFTPGQAYVALSRATDPNETVLAPHPYKSFDELFFTDWRVDQFYGR